MRQILFTALLLGAVAAAQAGSALPDAPPSSVTRFGEMLDLRHNAALVARPTDALALADAMSDPDFFMAAMTMSAHPEVWLEAIERAGSPDAPRNLARMISPEQLADWMYSSADPQFRQAVLSRMLDPKKAQRWMQAMSDPRFYLPALAMMNPATPMRWMKATADGRMLDPMRVWFDPATYANWMRLPAAGAAMPGGDGAPPAAWPQWPAWQPPQRY